jgi:hypothetical protein
MPRGYGGAMAMMNKYVAAAKDGLRFGLLIGSGAGLLDTLLKGLHLSAFLSTLFFCSVGGLIGALSHRWFTDHQASRRLCQPPVGTSGEGI